MSRVRRAGGRVLRAARELIGRPPAIVAPPPAPPPAAPVPRSVGLSDGRVLCDHPIAPHMIVDGYCLLVSPRVIMGSYEPAVTWFLHRAVEPGDVVVDIGANQGFHTLTLGLGVVPDGHVWSFEPHPRTRLFLEQNIATVGLHHTVTVVDAAAWSSDGEQTFRARRGEAAGSFLREAFSMLVDDVHAEDVTVRTVDTGAFLAGLPSPPALIKIDAEGSETEILRSAEPMLRAHHPTVVLEILTPAFASPQAVDDWERWLRDLGYEIGQLDDRGALQPLGPDGLRAIEMSADVVLWVPGGRGAPR